MNDTYDVYEPEIKMTPLQMVRQYHRTTGQVLDYKFPDIEYSDADKVKEWAKDNEDQAKEMARLGDFRHKLISEEWEEVQKAVGPEEMLKEMADLVYVIYGTAATFGLDLDTALERVHENNMGRMWHTCQTCDGNSKVILRREDGKILKNPDYPKVNLKDLV